MIGKSVKPIYQASAILVVNLNSTATPYDVNGSLAMVPTYAQLLTSPTVLDPVVANHPELTLAQLSGMISVKPQSNTQNIELDVQNQDPVLAMQLANEISQSLDQFANTRLSGGIQVIPALLPTSPITHKASLYAGIGALVGLALAVAFIILFEWLDDRLSSPEEVQEILGLDPLTSIARLSSKQRMQRIEEVPAFAEGCSLLCAKLNAAQAMKPFKLMMVTSALPEEGRSTIAATLASCLALSGKRILLVDADLRRPSLYHRFQLNSRLGLASAIQVTWINAADTESEHELEGQPTQIPMLRVLPAGMATTNPAELLQTEKAHQIFDTFKKMPQYDYVIFDTPPLLPIADAQVVASYVDAAILVVDASQTPRRVLVRAKQALSKTRATILGVVINKSVWSEGGNINGYLNDVWRRQSKARVSVTTPPSTPPIEDLAEPDMSHDIANGMNYDIPGTMNPSMDQESITLTIARPIRDTDGNYPGEV